MYKTFSEVGAYGKLLLGKYLRKQLAKPSAKNRQKFISYFHNFERCLPLEWNKYWQKRLAFAVLKLLYLTNRQKLSFAWGSAGKSRNRATVSAIRQISSFRYTAKKSHSAFFTDHQQKRPSNWSFIEIIRETVALTGWRLDGPFTPHAENDFRRHPASLSRTSCVAHKTVFRRRAMK